MPTTKEILKIVSQSATGKKALRTLGEKCKLERIAILAYQYCFGASPKEKTAMVKSASNVLSRWERVVERLRADADEVTKTNSELAEHWIVRFDPRHEHSVVTEMMEYADFLENRCKTGRLGVKPTKGRNEALAYLCYLVKAATGEEHFPEIATVIGFLKDRTVYRTDESLNKAVDAIRNRVARFEKGHSVQEEGSTRVFLREEAEDEVAEWEESKQEKEDCLNE